MMIDRISGPLLGLGLHYCVALGAAAVYYVGSRWLPTLNRHAVISGVLYGALTHVFMNFVVIPLSAIGSRPFAPKGFIAFLIVSMAVVGPSISIMAITVIPKRSRVIECTGIRESTSRNQQTARHRTACRRRQSFATPPPPYSRCRCL